MEEGGRKWGWEWWQGDRRAGLRGGGWRGGHVQWGLGGMMQLLQLAGTGLVDRRHLIRLRGFPSKSSRLGSLNPSPIATW